MSRRVDPRAERAAQNQATLKSLVKLESNKSCADCKRNKHPRWASWNLGIFICIRCSGIHRGMGTHISRVKSVDLDSWTDEQLGSMLRWGNSRANKYWEAKLAPGHVPSESKIENFIRTKYDSKRWVMDGGMPDPASLDTEADDDVPLNVVQEKAKMERNASVRSSAASSPAPAPVPIRKPPPVDLFGDEPVAPPSRPSTNPPMGRPPPPKAEAAPPKQTKPGDSLLGLDFFGGSTQSTPPSRTASVTQASATSSMPSRPDLKQSILSLYAQKPAAAAPVQHQRTGSGAFGSLASPAPQSPAASQSGFGGLNDAFSSLSFSSASSQPAAKPDAFASLASPTARTPAFHGTTSSMSGFGSGGSFFDAMPSKPAPPPVQRTFSSNSGFGDFSSMTSPAAAAPPKPAASSGDLFDLSFDGPPAQSAKPVTGGTSAFNLSSPITLAQPAQSKPQPANFSTGLSNMDAWGSNDVWASSSTTTAAPAATPAAAPKAAATSGWGAASTPQVAQDDDFGGWSSAPTPGSNTTKPSAGLGGGDDLFANVWE
ncbi:ArfGap-domain-containing protein [Saccharata proteae CBS 121410]|uniref:ArfGap-domain-containing protein n=1 Tax=Saccharata proteae CBS 121410 TaxID=1314787 RepID=A0A9P4I278_9PEZI|nr:ArfGap-domain-containing protein [Saccharata proteae CBS 121410]